MAPAGKGRDEPGPSNRDVSPVINWDDEGCRADLVLQGITRLGCNCRSMIDTPRRGSSI